MTLFFKTNFVSNVFSNFAFLICFFEISKLLKKKIRLRIMTQKGKSGKHSCALAQINEKIKLFTFSFIWSF
jgi:hypothetical protein